MEPQRLSILLVEDDEIDAEMITRMLSAHSLQRVPSYRDALSRLYNGAKPDLVMIDLGLPDTHDMDPVVMVRNVVRAFSKSAVVVLTGMADHELAVACRGAGAQEYLFKEPTLLRAEIDGKVRGAYAHKQLEIRHLNTADTLTDFLDPNALDRRIEAAVVRAVATKAPAPPEDELVPPTVLNRIRKWLSAHYWKIGTAIVATVLYLVDFRDRIRDYTRETEEFRVETTAAVEAQKNEVSHLKDNVRTLKKATVKNQILQVRAVEQLQLEIRSLAPPKAKFAEDLPEIKAAKAEVEELDARAKLFGEDPDDTNSN